MEQLRFNRRSNRWLVRSVLRQPLWQIKAMSWLIMMLRLDASGVVKSILNASLTYYAAVQALWINAPNHFRDTATSRPVPSQQPLDVAYNLGMTGAINQVFRR